MIPRRGSPALTPSYQAQRDMLTIAETAIAAMQRNASETIAQVSIASINALREINAAHAASMERAQQTLERIRALITDARRMQAQADAQPPQETPQIPKQSAQRARKGSGEGQARRRRQHQRPWLRSSRHGAVTKGRIGALRRVGLRGVQ